MSVGNVVAASGSYEVLHRVKMERDATFTFAANTLTDVPFDKTFYDIGGLGDTTTGEITIVKNGFYAICAKYMPGNAFTLARIRININGTALDETALRSDAGTEWHTLRIYQEAALSANDVVTIQILSNPGASVITGNTQDRTFVTVTQLP